MASRITPVSGYFIHLELPINKVTNHSDTSGHVIQLLQSPIVDAVNHPDVTEYTVRILQSPIVENGVVNRPDMYGYFIGPPKSIGNNISRYFVRLSELPDVENGATAIPDVYGYFIGLE